MCSGCFENLLVFLFIEVLYKEKIKVLFFVVYLKIKLYNYLNINMIKYIKLKYCRYIYNEIIKIVRYLFRLFLIRFY